MRLRDELHYGRFSISSSLPSSDSSKKFSHSAHPGLCEDGGWLIGPKNNKARDRVDRGPVLPNALLLRMDGRRTQGAAVQTASTEGSWRTAMGNPKNSERLLAVESSHALTGEAA